MLALVGGPVNSFLELPGCLPSAHQEAAFYNILVNRNCELK